MKCYKCKNEMILDDKDKSFEGCEDRYWYCEKCEISCIEEIRFHQRYRAIWQDENNGKRTIIKYKIRGL